MHRSQFCKELDICIMLCTGVFPVGVSLLYWGGCVYKQRRFQKYNKILLTNINYINPEEKIPFKAIFKAFQGLPKLLALLTSCICSFGVISFAHSNVLTIHDAFQASGTSLYLLCSGPHSSAFHSFTCNYLICSSGF